MWKKTKTWDILGILLGLSILLVGIVFMVTPPESYRANSVDDISFGADCYTEQYNEILHSEPDLLRVAESSDKKRGIYGKRIVAGEKHREYSANNESSADRDRTYHDRFPDRNSHPFRYMDKRLAFLTVLSDFGFFHVIHLRFLLQPWS